MLKYALPVGVCTGPVGQATGRSGEDRRGQTPYKNKFLRAYREIKVVWPSTSSWAIMKARLGAAFKVYVARKEAVHEDDLAARASAGTRRRAPRGQDNSKFSSARGMMASGCAVSQALVGGAAAVVQWRGIQHTHSASAHCRPSLPTGTDPHRARRDTRNSYRIPKLPFRP